MNLELLLLDAGNTLVYLDHDAVAAVAGVSADALRHAEPIAKRRYEAELLSGSGHARGWFRFMGWLVEEAGARGDIEALVAGLRAEHDRLNLWRRVPPELPGALHNAARAGLRLGIVSNSEGQLPTLLQHVGLGDFFEHVVDSHVEGVSKPDPAIFRIALERFGVDARNALYAGDLPDVDVAGARAAGMQAALVDTLDHYPEFTSGPRFRQTSALIDALVSGRL